MFSVENSVFFQVVDPRPESKASIRVAHIAEDRSIIAAHTFAKKHSRGTRALLGLAGGFLEEISLHTWVAMLRFQGLMAVLVQLRVRPAGMSLLFYKCIADRIGQSTHRTRPMFLGVRR